MSNHLLFTTVCAALQVDSGGQCFLMDRTKTYEGNHIVYQTFEEPNERLQKVKGIKIEIDFCTVATDIQCSIEYFV